MQNRLSSNNVAIANGIDDKPLSVITSFPLRLFPSSPLSLLPSIVAAHFLSTCYGQDRGSGHDRRWSNRANIHSIGLVLSSPVHPLLSAIVYLRVLVFSRFIFTSPF